MNYVKINVWYYGRKHISSGVYLISGEEDDIGMNGYNTTLSLIRVGPDEDFDSAAPAAATASPANTSIADMNNSSAKSNTNGNNGLLGGGGKPNLVMKD